MIDDQALAPTDSDTLLAATHAGDAEALAALCQRWSGAAVGLAARILGDQASAEDAVEEALLAVWRGDATYEPGGVPAHAWFLSIVHQRALDRLRTERPRDPAHGEQVAPTSMGDDLPATRALEPDQRRFLEMGYFAGLTKAEIAAATGMTSAMVQSQLTAAIDALSKALDVTTPTITLGPGHTPALETFAKTAFVIAGYDQEWEAFDAHMPQCPRCTALFVASGLAAEAIAALAGDRAVPADFAERLLTQARANPPVAPEALTAESPAAPAQNAQATTSQKPRRRRRLRVPAHWRQLLVVAGIPLAIAVVLLLWNLQVQTSLDDQLGVVDRQNTILRYLAPGAHVTKLIGSDEYKNVDVLFVQPNDGSRAIAYIRQLPPASSGRTYFFWYGNQIQWVPAVNFQMPDNGALALPLSPVGPGVTRVQITIESVTGPVENNPGPVVLSASLS